MTLLSDNRKQHAQGIVRILGPAVLRVNQPRHTFPGRDTQPSQLAPLTPTDGSKVKSINVQQSSLRKYRTHPLLPRPEPALPQPVSSVSPITVPLSPSERVTEEDFLADLPCSRPLTRTYRLNRKGQGRRGSEKEVALQHETKRETVKRIPLSPRADNTSRNLRSTLTRVGELSPLSARLPTKLAFDVSSPPEVTLTRASPLHRDSIFSIAPLRIPERTGEKGKTLQLVASGDASVKSKSRPEMLTFLAKHKRTQDA